MKAVCQLLCANTPVAGYEGRDGGRGFACRRVVRMWPACSCEGCMPTAVCQHSPGGSPFSCPSCMQALIAALPLGPQAAAGGISLPEAFKVGRLLARRSARRVVSYGLCVWQKRPRGVFITARGLSPCPPLCPPRRLVWFVCLSWQRGPRGVFIMARGSPPFPPLCSPRRLVWSCVCTVSWQGAPVRCGRGGGVSTRCLEGAVLQRMRRRDRRGAHTAWRQTLQSNQCSS